MVINNVNDLPPPWFEEGKPSKVSVDNGYARQKVSYFANVDGEKTLVSFSYPSRVAWGARNMDMQLSSSGTGIYNVGGSDYTVGEYIEDPIDCRGKDYATSEVNTVLITHSLVTAGFAGKEVILATGLPFSHYFTKSGPDTNFIEAVKNAVAVPKSIPGTDDASQLPVIVEHKVFPESTAAFIDYAFDIKTGQLKTIEMPMIVADMGGETTDVTRINPGPSPQIDRGGSDSAIGLGVLYILESLNDILKSTKSLSHIGPKTLETALLNNNCRIKNQPTDVSEEVQAAKVDTVKKLQLFLNKTIGDAVDVEAILFVGGGAEVLKDVFLSKYDHGVVLDNPEFSNSRGMLKYLEITG